MQDKRKGQDLTDMAWGKMEAILDKEMPQKKDKQRYFIWMIFGALLIIALGVGLVLENKESEAIAVKSISSITKSKEEEKTDVLPFEPAKNEILEATESPEIEFSISESAITESPISKSSVNKSTEFLKSHSANTPEREATLISKTSKEINGSTNEISKKRLDITTSQRNNIIELSNSIDQTKKLNSTKNNQTVQNNVAKTAIKHLDHGIVIETLEHEKPIVTSKADLNNGPTKEINQTVRKIEEEKQVDNRLNNIDLLPQLPIPFISKPTTNVLNGIYLPEVLAPPSTKVVKAKSKLKLLPGIYAGAHFNPVFNFGGYEFGLTLTAPVAKRVSLSTGIGIADLNKKGFERIGIFDQNSNPASFEDLLNSNGAFAFDLKDLSTTELASSLQKLVYVQMPITLNYSLNKRIEFSGGMNFAYLVNASAEGRVPSNLDPLVQARDYAISTSELFEENVLNRWDAQLIAGFNMKFGKLVKLNVNYRHGLNHTLNSLRGNRPTGSTNDTGIKDFNRTIFVGINYTFPTKKAK
jgi:hypothetical protein